MNLLSHNPLLRFDGYKYAQFSQYPGDATSLFHYIEARGTKIPGITHLTYFGPQSFIRESLMKPITMADVDQAVAQMNAYGTPVDEAGWRRIVNVHGGYFPVRIRALPEGSIVPLSNALLTVESLDDELPSVGGLLEDGLLMSAWYGSTVATVSRTCREYIADAWAQTSDRDPAGIGFALHDFGLRGSTGFDGAGRGGAAHLVNFNGTDTIPGISHARDFYSATGIVGVGAVAMEHSTVTSWGRAHEVDAYTNFVHQHARAGAVLSIVIDSYDMIEAVKMIHAAGLFEHCRKLGTKLVMRPDSGNPLVVPVDVISLLMSLVGSTVNGKGFQTLPDHVGVLQGDGINIQSIPKILTNMKVANIAADCIVFGMGSGLLQQCDRDTFSFAMKASSITRASGTFDVYKDPVTDTGKRSKRGRVTTTRTPDGYYRTVPRGNGWQADQEDAMRTIYQSFEGNTVTDFQSFDDVRRRGRANFK